MKLFLWLRYLRKKRIVLLSIAAVALSVTLLIVVTSLFTGFIKFFEQSAVEAVGDVVVAPPVRFAKYSAFIQRLEQAADVNAATATLSAQGLLHLGKGNVRRVNIWGIEPGGRVRVTGFKQALMKQSESSGAPSFEVPGHPKRTGGFVGIAVVAEPNEKTDRYDIEIIEKMIGEQVVLTTGTVSSEQSSKSAKPEVSRKSRRFTILDVVETGVYELDKRFIYLPRDELQRILYPSEEGEIADQIQIKLEAGVDPKVALAEIRGLWYVFASEEIGWSRYRIKETKIATAQQMQGPYVEALRKQMRVLLVIFSIVSMSVVVLIFCIFYMIVRLKQRDVAIIKSCGASSVSVVWLFVGFGACVGIIGSLIGGVAGYIITKEINTLEEGVRVIFGLKLWKSSVYMFSKIPNEVDWSLALPIVLFAIAAAAIGAVLPALVAARTKPVEILRYE